MKTRTKEITDKDGKEYSYAAVSRIIGKHESTVRLWVKEYGLTTLEEMQNNADIGKEETKRLRIKKAAAARKANRKPVDVRCFQSDFCHRERGTEMCKFYSDCQESRVFAGEHSPKYNPDGSCFTLPVRPR